MSLLLYTFLGLLGIAVGSFIGMLSFRLPRGLSLSGRSFCDHCARKILLAENIPIISYLLLGGRCRGCKKRIPLAYPLIELSTAVLFVATFIIWDNLTSLNGIAYVLKENLGILSLIAYLLLLIAFICLLAIDLTHQLLPDGLLYIAGAVIILSIVALPSPLVINHLLSGLTSFSFFLLIYLVTQKKGMGFGDVKLSFWLGLLLGYPEALVWIFLSFATGAAVGIILILLGKAQLKKPIPFGPFLIISAVVAFLFGEILFNTYLNL